MDTLLPTQAIVECFYPGATGGTAVAETVFGLSNRFGKLPVTYYNYAFTEVCRAACPCQRFMAAGLLVQEY